MLPSKDSATTTRTIATLATDKRTGPDIPRLMRPQSVLKHYMKYLTPYEHQEIFNYSQVELQHAVRSAITATAELFVKIVYDFYSASA